MSFALAAAECLGTVAYERTGRASEFLFGEEGRRTIGRKGVMVGGMVEGRGTGRAAG